MELDLGSRFSLSMSVLPFAFAAVLAWVAVLFGSSIELVQYGCSLALMVLAGALTTARAKEWWTTRFGGVLPALIFFAAVGLLRDSAGGISSGVGVLALIPVFYTALYGEGRMQLAVVVAGLGVFYLAPVVIVGPPAYPSSQYRAALVTVAVSAIIGVATRRLVGAVRHEAGEAVGREQLLRRVHEVVRGLYDSGDARNDVCAAARTIGEASIAILYEPVRGNDTMRSTAMAGLEQRTIEISTREPSAVSEAFHSGQARLIERDARAHVGSVELWEAGGSPATLLYEPLMRGSEAVGVLVVGWPEGVEASGSRTTVAALLAHEAAAVIERADTVSRLADMASTDPLTGLPNRRAWDARVAHAQSVGESFSIAMLDFDNFKQFNDTHGHPAGDRLLKETASRWREQVRSVDVLARLGGEEFGLLLINCPEARAVHVIERLRASISNDRTCSAGYAAQRPGESAEAVMARADAALYDAKAAGRDRVCLSV